MRHISIRFLSISLGFAAIVLTLGFDVYRPLHAERIRQLEMEVEGYQDELEGARREIAALTVRLEETEETLLLEQDHRERAEARLKECEGRE